MKASCTVSNVCKADIGFYICKAVNCVSDIATRAKLDLASSATAVSGRKTTTETSSSVKETVSMVQETASITSKETSKIKSEKKSAKTQHKKLMQSQKTVKEDNTVMTSTLQQIQKDAKQDIEIVETEHTMIEPAHLEIIRETDHQESVNASKFKMTSKNERFEDHEVEILEESEEIHVKIYKEVYSAEEMESLKIADEVNAILDSIEAHQFGSGERPLRELATIGHLLKKGIQITEIIQMYDDDFFTALKLPESQSALVQLVERQGYENLITEILNDTASTDEKLLASTVGFRAFMRLIEITQIPVEEIIKNFKFEDFVSQEWKHKEIKDNEYVEVTESHVSSIRAEKITIIGNEFE